MRKKMCENCHQIIGNLEESFIYKARIVCKSCKMLLEAESQITLSSNQKSLSEALGVTKENPPPKVCYIRKHWRGELSLAVSFWINYILLNFISAIIVQLASFAITGFMGNPVIAARLSIFLAIFIVLACIIVYAWQVIGLWRSCNNHIVKSGKRFWARTAQIIVVLGMICVYGSWESSWETYGPIYKDLLRFSFKIDDKYGNYTLKLEKDNTLIHLQGGLGLGISEEVARLLKAHPEIEGIILDSPGGRIYEGRALAKLISAYNLDTYSLEDCYSAATVAFIAGKNRFLGTGANLAFHQYQVGYESVEDLIDMKDEQAKDLPLFRQQGVESDFLDKLFEASNDDLWYPTIDEMLNAGVIHGIVNPSDLLPIKYNLSSNEFEEAILDIPLYETIKKYEPDTYRNLLENFSEQIKNGATPIELQHGASNFIKTLASKSMSRTSNDALIQFNQTLIVYLKKLKAVDPVLCMKALYPQQYGVLEFSKHGSDDEQRPMLDAMEKVIIDAYEKDNPSVNVEAAELLMGELALELEEQAHYLELENLQNTDDYGQHCDAIIKLYGLILAEDKTVAGNMLRYLLSLE